MMPGVQVLVSYIRPDGEIVADYLKLTVSTELENQVCAVFSKHQRVRSVWKRILTIFALIPAQNSAHCMFSL